MTHSCCFCSLTTSNPSAICESCVRLLDAAQTLRNRPKVIVTILMEARVPPILLADAVAEVQP